MKYETNSYVVLPRIIHSRKAKPTFCYVDQIDNMLLQTCHIVCGMFFCTYLVANVHLLKGTKYEEK